MDHQHIAAKLDLTVHDADEIAAFYGRIFRQCRAKSVDSNQVLSIQASGHRIGPFSLLAGTSASGIEFTPAEPLDYILVKFVVGREEVWAPQRYVIDDNLSLIVNASHVSRTRWHGGAAERALVVDRATLTQELAAMLDAPVHKPLEFHPTFDPRSRAGALLLSMTTMLHNGLEDDAPLRTAPIAAANIMHSVSNLLLESMEHNFSDALRRPAAIASPRQVKRAIDFMKANLDQPISLAEIAAASQVSVRALQIAFREFRSATPMAYLRTLRLEAAHRDLIDAAPDINVADVARKWGFTHLGRFADQYRATYGVYPSGRMKRANEQRHAS